MKEKDFYGVVYAIAQFIERADSEPEENKNVSHGGTESHRYTEVNREDEAIYDSSK